LGNGEEFVDTDMNEVCDPKASAINGKIISVVNGEVKEINDNLDRALKIAKTFAVKDETASWKTYTNSTYSYSIKYPSSLSVREFPDTNNGCGFRVVNGDADVIVINYETRATDDFGVPLREYVKNAFKNIQNHESLASNQQISTDSGIIGYETTDNVQSMHSSEMTISLPITYFPPADNNTRSFIEFSLNDQTYTDTYNKMISTFQFTQ
jgi:hypothetical protein